jgi:hypothetical protein
MIRRYVLIKRICILICMSDLEKEKKLAAVGRLVFLSFNHLGRKNNPGA